jgi:hypothetical protein
MRRRYTYFIQQKAIALFKQESADSLIYRPPRLTQPNHGQLYSTIPDDLSSNIPELEPIPADLYSTTPNLDPADLVDLPTMPTANTSSDEILNSDDGTDTDNTAFDPVCYDLDLTTNVDNFETTQLTRPEKLLLAFYKDRHHRILHDTRTMERLPTLPPTDDDPCTTSPYIQEETESADDWDTSDDTISSTPPTPPPPPIPPAPPSDAPGPSIPASPPFAPPGNLAITKIKQKFLTLFKKF